MEHKLCIFCEKENPTIQCQLMCGRMFHQTCLVEPYLFKKGTVPDKIQCLECLHGRKRCLKCEHLVLEKEKVTCIKCDNWFHKECSESMTTSHICESHTCTGILIISLQTRHY